MRINEVVAGNYQRNNSRQKDKKEKSPNKFFADIDELKSEDSVCFSEESLNLSAIDIDSRVPSLRNIHKFSLYEVLNNLSLNFKELPL